MFPLQNLNLAPIKSELFIEKTNIFFEPTINGFYSRVRRYIIAGITIVFIEGRKMRYTRTVMPNRERKTGYPSGYRRGFAKIAYHLALLGANNTKIAEVLSIDCSTITDWNARIPEFKEAMDRGRAQADGRVAESLYKRARGFSHPDTHISSIKDRVTGEIHTVVTPFTKHYPPDTLACIFWLKNRVKETWHDAKRTEHTGADGKPIAFQPDLSTLTDAELEMAATLGLKLHGPKDAVDKKGKNSTTTVKGNTLVN
jgi:hypothetical protein